MNITWVKVGAVFAVLAPPVGAGMYFSHVETRVDLQDKRIDLLAEDHAAIARIDERTVAMQTAIGEIKDQLKEEKTNGR